MTGVLDFVRIPHPSPSSAERRQEILSEPGFGQYFTDHMVSITYTEGVGWLAQRLKSERQKGLAIVFASHEPELVDSVATRVIQLGAARG